jgi:hypothetical protein
VPIVIKGGLVSDECLSATVWASQDCPGIWGVNGVETFKAKDIGPAHDKSGLAGQVEGLSNLLVSWQGCRSLFFHHFILRLESRDVSLS